MNVIGIVAEYNPFHNGHIYQIKKVRELYKDTIIIVVVNGYFLERGEISVLSKEEKTRICLEYGVDLVLELPFVFVSNSADIFAESAVSILNKLGVNKLIFGSESNNLDFESCNLLGKMYLEGKYLDKNEEQAFKLFNKGCVNKYPASCLYLGKMYNAGISVKINDKKRDEYYQTASTMFFNNCNDNKSSDCLQLGLMGLFMTLMKKA